MISIIIRTKNEERWIAACLQGVFEQDYRDFEVILVDNGSSDKTKEKALDYNITKVIACPEYKPGLAINMGIRESRGEFIACLSGHCIPTNREWLPNLIRNFGDERVAGVYGRQEPLSFTADSDKRDLSIIFGRDSRIQEKDSFFHNANSMIRRSIWEEIPFDETVTNIEDRVWAERVIQRGNLLVYEPEASVYHYHGIHQDGNMQRCAKVVKILDDLWKDSRNRSYIDVTKPHIVTLIPIKGAVKYLSGRPLISYTIENARKSKYVERVIAAPDNLEAAKIIGGLGVETPFIRDKAYSADYVDIALVLKHCVEKLDELKIFPDLIVSLEATFPFRPSGLIDNLVEILIENGLDTVIAAKRENKSLWKESPDGVKLLDEGLTPRAFKDAAYIGLRGLCCVTHPNLLRQGKIYGERIGIFEVGSSVAPIEVRNGDDYRLAEILIDKMGTLLK